MSIDKFGRYLDPFYITSGGKHSTLSSYKVQFQFPLTSEGDVNFTNKRLTNINLPRSLHDAASKKYVDESISSFTKNIQNDLHLIRDSVAFLVNKLNQDLQSIIHNINLIEQTQKNTIKEEITRINESIHILNNDLQSVKNIATDVSFLKQQIRK